MTNQRFDVHKGSDCVIRYLPHVQYAKARPLREIVYGPVLYVVRLTWKKGGMEKYLQRLMEMGLIGGRPDERR